MSTIFLGLLTLAAVIAVGFLIAVLTELKATLRSMNEFLKTTENSLRPTLEDVQMTLKSLRGVTDNVTAVTEDIRVLSGSVREVGENVKRASRLIEDLTSSAVVKASGLRAGIRAATEVLVQNLLAGKQRQR